MASVDFGRYKRIVQYFWDPEPKNDDVSQSSIWCLGKEYPGGLQKLELSSLPENKGDTEADHETVMVSSDSMEAGELKSCNANGGAMTAPYSEEDRGWPSDFLDDFEARYWFTYRSHFQPIKKSSDSTAASSMSLSVRLRSQLVDQGGFTSDTGWGCMIRSGQCLLANALGIRRFGRAWRRGAQTLEEKDLLALFADDPKAPFSIHRFVEHGAAACDKHPGEWFGPSATARCIQSVSSKVNQRAKANIHRALSHSQRSCGIRVYIAGDGADVYEDTLLKLARDDHGVFQPVLILLGIRLGIDRITPVYWEALKASLQLSQSIGIAGGRPSSSHYFSGVQGNHFFYHDPHQTRPALLWHEKSSDYTAEEIDSCHTRRLRRLHVKDMDPSMLIAFLILDEADWRNWRQGVNEIKGKSVVHIAEREPLYQGKGNPAERAEAIAEVESFDDEEDQEDDGELVEVPRA
ncbi:Cysteine protease atg4 [Lambiella insularis]|nr:Cysteine protease atg4 [Lambiella insularis]